jgi:c-di-GMP-related signal transduction protein
MTDGKPTELIRMAIFGVCFCEKLASLVSGLKDKSGSLYTMGSFSLLDSIEQLGAAL